jgi:hypothetical protein
MPSGNTLHRNFTYSRDNGRESPKSMMTQVLDNGLRQQAISVGRATLQENCGVCGLTICAHSIPWLPPVSPRRSWTLPHPPLFLHPRQPPTTSPSAPSSSTTAYYIPVDNSLLHGRVRHPRVELHFLPMQLQMLTFSGKMSSSKPTLDETADDTVGADALGSIKVCSPLGAFQSLPAPSCLQVSVCRCLCRC